MYFVVIDYLVVVHFFKVVFVYFVGYFVVVVVDFIFVLSCSGFFAHVYAVDYVVVVTIFVYFSFLLSLCFRCQCSCCRS